MKERHGISQEVLKLIACLTMLIDHIGVVLFPNEILRIIGRIAFPIYCFLLVEGIHYTRNAKKYGLRLLISVFLSELAFDLAFSGRIDWMHNNVMITLLLGFLAVQLIHCRTDIILKVLGVLMLALAGELLHSDYGCYGVFLIVLFDITRELPYKRIFQFVGMLFLFYSLGGISIYAVLSIIPISFYSSRKTSHSKALQWAFYLFYPVHMLVLYAIKIML